MFFKKNIYLLYLAILYQSAVMCMEYANQNHSREPKNNLRYVNRYTDKNGNTITKINEVRYYPRLAHDTYYEEIIITKEIKPKDTPSITKFKYIAFATAACLIASSLMYFFIKYYKTSKQKSKQRK
jgi:hypothetical protein